MMKGDEIFYKVGLWYEMGFLMLDLECMYFKFK